MSSFLTPCLKSYQETTDREQRLFDILFQSLAEAFEDKGCQGWGRDFSDVLCFHRNQVFCFHRNLIVFSHRDAVAKILYSLLFSWLTERINGRVYPRNEALSISILDIYGFEVKLKIDLARHCHYADVFEQMCIDKLPYSPVSLLFNLQELQVNSFEQLCINYANETLQFFFNRVIFQEEQVREQSAAKILVKIVLQQLMEKILNATS